MSEPVAEEIRAHLQQIIDNEKRLVPNEVVESLDQIKYVGEILKPLKVNIQEIVGQDAQVLLMTAVSAGKDNALDVILNHVKEQPTCDQKVLLMEEALRTDNPGAIRVMAKFKQISREVREATQDLVEEAVKSNQPEVLQQLVSAGYGVDHGQMKAAPIHIAAREGNVDCAKILIDAGCNLDVKSDLNDSPFIEAILTASLSQSDNDDPIKVAELLAQAGCKVNEIGLDGRAALHVATVEANAKQVEFLIKTAKVDLNTKAETSAAKGYTALQMAIQFTEKADVVKMLVDAGCDVDKTSDKFETALHLAVRAPVDVRDEYTRILVEKGCRLDVQNSFGNTPLHDCKHPGLLAYLVHNTNEQVLNIKNNHGRTPLHSAIDCGFDIAVSEMLERNADPLVCDLSGDTVLHLACRDELLEAIASAGESQSKVPLTKVPDAFTSGVPYPLPSVMIGFGISMATFMRLVGRIPDVDVQNKNGETSLHVAINHNCKRIVEALLNASADAFNIYDRKGLNAYDLATSKQGVTPEILNLLEQRQSQHRVPFVNAIDMLNKLMKTVKLDPTLSKREKKTFDSAITTLITLLKKNLPKDLAMPLEHRTILKRNRGMLVEEMVPKSIIACLVTQGVLDEDSSAEIEEELGRRKKCEKLLDVLLSRGRRAFPGFCKALVDTDQAFILELMQDKVETEIMKTDDLSIASEPPRGRPMINEHREFLRLNRGRLVQQMQIKTSNKLYKKLVSGGVLTNEMVEEIQQESSEEKQCERVLDILPTRGRSAFPLFCQVMEQEEATSQESKQIMTTNSDSSELN